MRTSVLSIFYRASFCRPFPRFPEDPRRHSLGRYHSQPYYLHTHSLTSDSAKKWAVKEGGLLFSAFFTAHLFAGPFPAFLKTHGLIYDCPETEKIDRGQQRSFRRYQPPPCLNLFRCPRARGRVQSPNPPAGNFPSRGMRETRCRQVVRSFSVES